MSSVYRKLLARPEWKAKREECIEKAGHRCEKCGSGRNLQVHHPKYERGKLPWEYDDLIVLCASCHRGEHDFGAGKPPAIGGRTVLERKWFHSFNDSGNIHWQGQVLGHVQDGFYLVQLYEWMAGGPSNCEMVHFSRMVGWMFYCTDEEMLNSYTHGPAKRFVFNPEEAL